MNHSPKPEIESPRISATLWRWRLAIVGILASLGCYADLLTKRIVFGRMGGPATEGPRNVYWLFENYVGIETSVNFGALGGLGGGHINALSAISVVAILGIVWWVLLGGATRELLVTIAVGLILGGIMGNLYDRLGYWGMRGVRDWILLQYGSFIWPNFNIADSLLVVGSILLVFQSFRGASNTKLAVGADSNDSVALSNSIGDSA